MAVTVLTTKHGTSVGPSTYTQFNVVVQLGYDGSNSTGYNMYVRYYVRVSKSSNTSNFTNNLRVSWTSTLYGLSKVGDYAISNWISLGTKAYGTKVTASANCWYERSNGTVLKSSADASYTIPTPTYTVSYNANGGSNAPNSQTKYHGTNIVLSSTKPTRAGHTFLGWGTSSTDTTVDYASGGTYTANASITLYAIWQIHIYAVTYNANGGSNAPSGQTKLYGVTLPLQTAIPTRENYNFLGWATNSSATTPTYKSGDNYTNNASVTLYAVWELAYVKPRINNFTVYRCDSNGNMADDGMYARVSFDWETDKENVQYRLYYKPTDETEYIETSAKRLSGTSGSVTGTSLLDTNGMIELDIELSYDIRLNVADEYGYNSVEIVLHSVFIPIDSTPDGRCMSFGEPAKDKESDVLRFGYKTVDIAPKERLTYHGEDFFGQTLLWSGLAIMDETHYINLSKPISEMKNGILLVFSRNGDYNLAPFFVPRQLVAMHTRTTYAFPLLTSLFDYVGQKTLNISDSKIEGHADNDATGKNGISGITYHNEQFFLRYVFEV